jgi:hypothetical protein
MKPAALRDAIAEIIHLLKNQRRVKARLFVGRRLELSDRR